MIIEKREVRKRGVPQEPEGPGRKSGERSRGDTPSADGPETSPDEGSHAEPFSKLSLPVSLHKVESAFQIGIALQLDQNCDGLIKSMHEKASRFNRLSKNILSFNDVKCHGTDSRHSSIEYSISDRAFKIFNKGPD